MLWSLCYGQEGLSYCCNLHRRLPRRIGTASAEDRHTRNAASRQIAVVGAPACLGWVTVRQGLAMAH